MTIVKFSHIPGQIEKIECDNYTIVTKENIAYVMVIKDDMYIALIPWNRIKEINMR
ncbi:hypothetical protein [Clostridium sporogenes]|uniref:hypothetical protein n=1 Tax=Clostridium sporogenes TaxID=1509 RepID=UPI001301B990|nr:hypothetical protein [Clostridium sporogenes]